VIPKFPIGRVREAVAEYVAAQASGEIGLYSAEDGVAKILGVVQRHGTGGARLEGQIYRTLTSMVDSGELRRDPPNPRRRTMPVFYTPDAYKAMRAARDTVAAERAARQERWAALHDELALWHMTNTNTGYNGHARGRPVHLDLDDFEQLMARARRGSQP
jgi:hypothetical protein